MSDLMELFRSEAGEYLQLLNDSLLELERASDTASAREHLDEMFRAAHSLKGMSATMGYQALAKLTHRMEDLLDRLRHGEMELDTTVADLLFEGLDALEAMLAQPEDAVVDEGLMQRYADALAAPAQMAAGQGAPGAPAVPPEEAGPSGEGLPGGDPAGEPASGPGSPGTATPSPSTAPVPDGSFGMQPTYRFWVAMSPSAPMKSVRGHIVLRALEDMEDAIQVIHYHPDPLNDPDEAFDDGMEITLRTDLPPDALAKRLGDIPDVARVDYVLVGAPGAGSEAAATAEGTAASAATTVATGPADVGAGVAETARAGAAGAPGVPAGGGPATGGPAAGASAAGVADAAAVAEEGDTAAAGAAAAAARGARPAVDAGPGAGAKAPAASAPAAAKGVAAAKGMAAKVATAKTAPAAAQAAAQAQGPRAPGAAGSRQGKPSAAARPGSASPQLMPDRIVRVDTEQLDALVNLVGELVIHRSRLLEVSAEAHHHNGALTETVEHIDRITDSLQDAVMSLRMVPVSQVFSRFPRVVRDICRNLGKQVEFTTEGEDTELDRSIVHQLGDPLVHLIRNALDHGIEPPEERRRLGKPEVGQLRLSARHQGNHVIIEVVDDGRGIDHERIAQLAVERGLIDQEELDALTPAQRLMLIFRPGFSTAKEVTDVSGRGVGMDAVRTAMESLNGQVEMHSEKGVGTRVVLRLPLTLAIIPALFVRCGTEVYALPLEYVQQNLRLRPEEIHTIQGIPHFRWRDNIVAVRPLADLMRLPPERRRNGSAEKGQAAVVIDVGSHQAVLQVDEIVGQQEIVIKNLGAVVGDITGVAGATVLGNGTVALILDLPALLA